MWHGGAATPPTAEVAALGPPLSSWLSVSEGAAACGVRRANHDQAQGENGERRGATKRRPKSLAVAPRTPTLNPQSMRSVRRALALMSSRSAVPPPPAVHQSELCAAPQPASPQGHAAPLVAPWPAGPELCFARSHR